MTVFVVLLQSPFLGSQRLSSLILATSLGDGQPRSSRPGFPDEEIEAQNTKGVSPFS